jgi:hypothetical protein
MLLKPLKHFSILILLIKLKNRMKEYKIIKENSPDEFSKLVTEALNNGWELNGGLSIACYINQENLQQIIYSQSLLKENYLKNE